MKRAAQTIAMMAVAFLLAPGLYAGQSSSTSTSKVVATLPPGDSSPFPAAAAQHHHRDSDRSYPKVEWSLDYSFWRAMPTSRTNRIGYLHGGSTSVAYNFNNYLGLVADFGGFDNDHLTLFGPTTSQNYNANGSVFTYLFGPRISFRQHERFTPYVQALFGGVSASAVTISGCGAAPICTPLGSQTAFTEAFGAGIDMKLTHHIAWRIFEGNYTLTRFRDPVTGAALIPGYQKNVRFSSGIVFRFGGEPSAPPPPRVVMTASCSTDKEIVFLGSGDVVAVHVRAANADSNPVNYTWSATAGAVDGTGPDARWNSADRGLGVYMISAHVDNGRNGAADCSVNIRVQPRPNRPPVMSCSADRSTVTVGQPVMITAIASDPDDDKLTFAWRSNGGRIEGDGASIKFHTTGLAPGSYSINGRVDDGRGGAADCAVNVDVQAVKVVEPPAEQVQLESRLALHSIYFPTARPTVEHPEAGLVQSQEDVLSALATDFVRYLTFKPDAHLTLEGHADRRGAVEYNQHLTERRVDRTKSFLVAHGVPAASIETKAFGKEQNLDAAQVKQLLEDNPDLSPDERKKLESNLTVIVMANNRRVDVSLSTTGQQSVRLYPFNAKDSLTLISPAGTQGDKRTTAPAKKKPTPPKQ
jgi:outer membrane protein OmpA-like peptidoglycan-associated protein/opacity protein-like surface antigen